MFEKRRGLRNLGLGLLISGACACGQNPSAQNGLDLQPQPGFDGITETHFNLLATGCTLVAPTLDSKGKATALGTATFQVNDNETLYLFKRIADSQVVANTNNVDGGECAFPTTYRIIINDDGGAAGTSHKVFLDFYYGSFGVSTGAYSSKTPDLTGPNIQLNLTDLATNTLDVRGTVHPDIITFGSLTADSVTTTYGSFAFGSLVLQKDKVTWLETAPAARTYPDLSATGLTNIMLSTGPSDDVITGQGGKPIGATSGGLLDGNIELDVYGGNDNDVITSGDTGTAVNYLYGGCGSDVFLQQATKVADIITGGTGSAGCAAEDVDTVDYSIRTGGLTVTLGDTSTAKVPTGKIYTVKQNILADNDKFTINDGTGDTVFELMASSDFSTPTDATGSIQVVAQASMHDGDGFVLDDGVNTPVTFEYAVSVDAGSYTATSGATPLTNTIIDISGASSANDVADATYAQIAAHGPVGITATDPASASDTIDLKNNTALSGAIRNKTITQYGSDLTILGMSNGKGLNGSAIGVDIHLDLSAAQVASSIQQAIHAAGLACDASVSDGVVTVTFPAGALPANAALTWNVGAEVEVVDFSAGGVAPGANDGESGEGDDIGIDIANVIGGSGNDVIDASLATGFDHVLYGMAGDDTLTGSDGNDSLYGGLGNDSLYGLAGNDTLIGGDGNDLLQGGQDDDFINGDGVNCVFSPAPTAAGTYYLVTACTSKTAVASVTAGSIRWTTPTALPT